MSDAHAEPAARDPRIQEPRAAAPSIWRWGFERARVAARAGSRASLRALRALLPAARAALRFALPPVALAGLVVAIAALGFTRVEPGFAGVRQSNFGAGVDGFDRGLGLHFGLPGVHAWHLVDMRLRLLRFGADARVPEDRPALEFRTRDDSLAKAELALAWRVRAGEAHELVAQGHERNLAPRVQAVVEDVLRREFGKLSTQEWLDPERRSAKARDLVPQLESAFAALHVALDGLWLHGISFPAEFERKLQARQVAAQRELLALTAEQSQKARDQAARLKKETDLELGERAAEWQKEQKGAEAALALEVARIAARAEAYEKETRARADLGYDKAIAAAALEVDRATALGNRLRLEALEGASGRAYLAQQAAANLKVKSVALDSRAPGAPSLLDLDELVQRLLGASD